ncbi:MAG: hypothetical protein L3K10_00810 [Thermoplasmata archaeon]|nr:hypothetical protein [Thermoplasmata archaeon]
MAQNQSAGINYTTAAEAANNSSAYHLVANGLGSNLSFSYDGAYNLWSFSQVSCTPSIQSVDVVFTSTTPLGVENIVVTENATSLAVTSARAEISPLQTVSHTQNIEHGGGGNWAGYTFVTSEAVAAEWTVPNVGADSSGHCGASIAWNGYCDIAAWVGESAAGTGSSGIAQTGTDQADICTPTLGGYICTSIYAAWYEFFPDQSNHPCFAASSGDKISVSVSYSSSQYHLALWDFGNSQGCSSAASMAMGSPYYGQFETENPPGNPNGGNWETPTFGTAFTFYPETIATHQYAWLVSNSKNTQITQVTVDAMYNITGNCQHPALCTTNAFDVTHN